MKIYKDYDINRVEDLEEIAENLSSGALLRWNEMNDGEKLFLLQIYEEFNPDGTDWTNFNYFILFDSDEMLEKRHLMMEG